MSPFVNHKPHHGQDPLSELMHTYGQDVWNFAFSLCSKRELADDITQDVFLKAFRHLDTFRGQSSAKTWLLSITRNTVRDYMRQAFVRRVTLVEQLFFAGEARSAESEAVDAIVTDDVWQLALRLPAKLREVLILYAHHQLSTAEIAQVLHTTEGAAKARLHRARTKMKEWLEGGGKDGETAR